MIVASNGGDADLLEGLGVGRCKSMTSSQEGDARVGALFGNMKNDEMQASG